MGLEATFEVDEQSLSRVVDGIHTTFARTILESAKKYTPVETGDLEQSWGAEREDKHTTTIQNPNRKMTFLMGTGLWGPTGQPFCRKVAGKPMIFNWRYKGYALQVRECVVGINPRHVHGMVGETYNFIHDMETSVVEGTENALQELNK